RDPRLLTEERLGFRGQPVQQLVDARDVVRRLGERARELLDRRVTVELERIKALPARRQVFLMAMKDLRLGLGLELAELLAQTRDGLTELAQVEVDRVQLLIQPRLEDVDLARAIQQRIEQRRVDSGRLRALR